MSLRRLLSGYLLGTLLLTLLGVSGGVYLLVSRHLHRSTDQMLRSRLGNNPGWPLPSAASLAGPHVAVRIYDGKGKLLDQAGGPPLDAPEPRPEMFKKLQNRQRLTYPSRSRHEDWMMSLSAVFDRAGNSAGAIEIGTGMRPNQDLLRALAGTLALCTATGLGLSAVAAALLSRRLGAPVEQLAQTARAIAAGNWQARANQQAGPLEVRSLACDFNAMVVQLGESLEVQRRFVADASHELKTPLTALSAMAEILDTHEVDTDGQSRALKVICREVERMEQLVNDLLTLSKLEHPDRPANPLDLQQPTQELLEEYRLRRPNLSQRIEACPPVCISLSHWQRLLRNLLDNALHYSQDEIVVRLARQDNQVLLQVIDQGQGIPPEAMPKLFQRFFRVDSSRARSTGGTGLGLAIVHGIVVQAGGKIQVESQVGKGTTVTVLLAEAP